MKLYHLTAVPPGGVTMMAQGSFTAPRQQELVTGCGSTLELYTLRAKEGRLDPLIRVDAFAQLRSLGVFRLPGTRRDYLVVTSDSGSISVLSADAATGTFKRVHCEPFGKSGCRRIVPGQFLACEPRGRACMVGAIEKQKFAYVLNRDAEENLTISSPLEAHKSSFATFALSSLDVGFENPMFVALEKGYDPESQKMLVYYELDLGLNHVVRKISSPVRPSSSFIIPVPGDSDGPGGVLVCSFGWVTYRSLLDEDENGRLLSLVDGSQPNGVQNGARRLAREGLDGRLEARLPFREGTDSEMTMIVSGTAYQDKKGSAFFFLLCTEFGDLIKAEIIWEADRGATELRLSYFDTIPGPAYDMCIFRAGYLAVAVEGSDTLLLNFRQVEVPNDDPAGGFSTSAGAGTSSHLPEDAMDVDKTPNGAVAHANGALNAGSSPSKQTDDGRPRLMFKCRQKLAYLAVSAVLDSFAPVTSICMGKGYGSSGTLICATGRRSSGSIRAFQRGIAVMEISSAHQLPSRLSNVFTLKSGKENTFHRFIVVSYEGTTTVLEVGETRVEEIRSSGFELREATLNASQVSSDSFLQVHKHGVRLIPSGRSEDAKEWKPPVPSLIVAACCNREQCVVALSSGTLIYFEFHEEHGSLEEVGKVTDVLIPNGGNESASRDNEGSVPSLAIPEIPPGRRRSAFFVLGDRSNNKVRLYRIGSEGSMEPLGLHVAQAPIRSLAFVDFGLIDRDAIDLTGGNTRKSRPHPITYEPLLSVLIGTTHGALVRLSVDSVTGKMSNGRSTFLGPDAVHVEELRISGVPTCFAMGTTPWMIHPQGGRLAMSPLATGTMEHAAPFSTEQSPDGFVATSGSRLRLLSIDLINAVLNSALLPRGLPPVSIPSATLVGCAYSQTRTRTELTPRRIFRVSQDMLPLSRADQSTVPNSTSGELRDLFVVVETDHRAAIAAPSTEEDNRARNDEEFGASRQARGFRTVPASAGTWSSRLLLVRMITNDRAQEDAVGSEEDDDTDGSNPFIDIVPRAASVLDSVTPSIPDSCILSAVSAHSLGPNTDPDTLAYVLVSNATNLVISATSPHASKERGRMKAEGRLPSYSISTYKVERSSLKMVLLHVTRTTEAVQTMVPFRDMLLVGTGTAIRLYDLGKRQLLRKGEYKLAVRNKVSCLAVAGGDRIFVGDVQESVTLFKYIRPGTLANRTSENGRVDREGGQFVPIANDILPRWVVSLEILDYSTVCGCDKFGNIFILRLPSELAGVTDEFAGVTASERNRLGPGSRNAPYKLSVEACIHVGSAVIGLESGSLTAGSFQSIPGMNTDLDTDADQAIIYSTVNGGIGVLAPLRTRGDADFVRSVETELRKRFRSVCGREHTAYRSSFYPVKNVFDGDLCENFIGLSYAEQEHCAEAIGRNREDVTRKLEELRAAFL